MAIATNDTNTKEKAANFLEEIIQESIAKGDTRVQTRFPPEPNGYLHIGHAKSICINFGLAKKYGGKCNLRFDDTNPVKEDVEYVDSIKRDIRWLGFDWALERYASDYFDQLYDWAVVLIKKGLAYVDDQTQEEIRLTRGTVSEPGKESPWRNRSVEENLDLFERMKKGEFADGEKVLRAKIDMAHPNMLFRDTRSWQRRWARSTSIIPAPTLRGTPIPSSPTGPRPAPCAATACRRPRSPTRATRRNAQRPSA